MPVNVVAALPPPPTPAQQLTPTPLLAWACCVQYVKVTGLKQASVCGPVGAPSRIQRVHAAFAKKRIRWVAVGWGGKPPVPSSDTQSTNEILEKAEIDGPASGKWIDGQDVVGYFGEYVYMLQVPPADSDTLAFCLAPWASTPSLSVYSLSPGDFNKLLVGPSPAPQGFNSPAVTW